jgi:hypothetical protein
MRDLATVLNIRRNIRCKTQLSGLNDACRGYARCRKYHANGAQKLTRAPQRNPPGNSLVRAAVLENRDP